MQVLRETTAYRTAFRERIIEKAMQDFFDEWHSCREDGYFGY